MNKNLIILVIALITIAIIILFGYSNEPTSNEKGLTFETIKEGDTLTANLMVNNLEDVYAGDISIEYDSKKLEFLDVNKGSFLEQDNKEVMLLEQIMNTDIPGEINNIVISRVGPVEGATGSGELLKIRFKVLDSGRTNIGFNEVTIIDSNSNSIDSSFNSKTISI